MNPIRRFTIADFLMAIVTAVILVGCGESTNSPPVMHEAVKLSPEQELAALTNKAEAGDAEAQYNLGWMYANGEGVPKDAAKAVEWWQKAAAQGNAIAQYSLARMYAIGEGAPKNLTIAVDWLQKAAEQGDVDAQYYLGILSFTGNSGVPKNLAKAVDWLQKAAEQGKADAQLQLSTMYRDGKGVPRDSAKAVDWLQKAAAQGHAPAQLHLGLIYSIGEGVPEDRVVAYAWLNIAAINGDANALKNRNIVEARLSANQLAEAQRLSSNWKKGQLLAREGKPATASTGTPSTPGALAKKGTGTLFVVSKTGHAVTNQHVTNGCTELRIQGREGVAKPITEDAVNDLALVQIPGDVKDTATIAAEPAKLRQGEDIVAFGFPLNAVLSSGGNLTPGVVSALTGAGNNTNQLQITAPIQPGSSGSPVLNKKGEVVGVVSMKLDDKKMVNATGQIGQNINFAVSGLTLKTFLDTHKVEYRSGGVFSFGSKSTADLADEARKWTLVVECWR